MNMAETLRLRHSCHEWQNGHASEENCHAGARPMSLSHHRIPAKERS